MKAQIIQIGNSQGIRIPKAILEETKISGEVELLVTGEGILIKNIRAPRCDWDERFASLTEADNEAIPGRITGRFAKDEWQW